MARVDERRVHDAADPKGRRHPYPKGHDGSRRHAPDVPRPSATVATGALYMFSANKCTGAHTPCMATGETICAHACALTGSMAPLLEMPLASIFGNVNDEKIVIRSLDRNSPYDAKGMAFLPAPEPPYILAKATSFAMQAEALTAVVPINVAARASFAIALPRGDRINSIRGEVGGGVDPGHHGIRAS